jgi:hypothetical protein
MKLPKYLTCNPFVKRRVVVANQLTRQRVIKSFHVQIHPLLATSKYGTLSSTQGYTLSELAPISVFLLPTSSIPSKKGVSQVSQSSPTSNMSRPSIFNVRYNRYNCYNCYIRYIRHNRHLRPHMFLYYQQ